MTDADRPDGRVSSRSMAIAAFSTVVEWYDFTLYLYLATVLSRVFFGDGPASLITALAGFAVTYALRPVGAVVFGRIGDRHGRRRVMLLSMALMTGAMLATALLPTRAQIGPAAGWMLLLLRGVMAFSVGGEYTGVVAYMMEGASRHRRGLVMPWLKRQPTGGWSRCPRRPRHTAPQTRQFPNAGKLGWRRRP